MPTPIEWTDETWNPITGCTVLSPGCTNCYAMKLAGGRIKTHPSRRGLTMITRSGPVWNGQVRLNREVLEQPWRWDRPRRIFVCAHGDLFHEAVDDSWIDAVFGVMTSSPRHQFQVVTKRTRRLREYLSRIGEDEHNGTEPWANGLWRHLPTSNFNWNRDRIEDAIFEAEWPPPNVWIGTSVEDQERADERIPLLANTPAAIRFLSVEPLLSQVNLDAINPPGSWGERRNYLRAHPSRRIHWVIVGGESQPGARPMHPDWARKVRDDCRDAGIPFFFKQWGEWAPTDHVDLTRYDTRPRKFWEGDACYGLWRDGTRNGMDTTVVRVGKSAAGRTLDGMRHNAFPA